MEKAFTTRFDPKNQHHQQQPSAHQSLHPIPQSEPSEGHEPDCIGLHQPSTKESSPHPEPAAASNILGPSLPQLSKDEYIVSLQAQLQDAQQTINQLKAELIEVKCTLRSSESNRNKSTAQIIASVNSASQTETETNTGISKQMASVHTAQQTRRSQIECFYCKKVGHFLRECRKRLATEVRRCYQHNNTQPSPHSNNSYPSCKNKNKKETSKNESNIKDTSIATSTSKNGNSTAQDSKSTRTQHRKSTSRPSSQQQNQSSIHSVLQTAVHRPHRVNHAQPLRPQWVAGPPFCSSMRATDHPPVPLHHPRPHSHHPPPPMRGPARPPHCSHCECIRHNVHQCNIMLNVYPRPDLRCFTCEQFGHGYRFCVRRP